jgi:hypothetical protein
MSAADDFDPIADEDLIGCAEPHRPDFAGAAERWAQREQAEQADYDALDGLLDRIAFRPSDYTRLLDGMTETNRQETLHAVRRKYPVLVAREGASPDVRLEIEKENLRRSRQARRDVDAEERVALEKPQPVSLSDLLAEPDEDVVYRMHGLWAVGGRIVLAAQNKTGKTTMVNNVVRSLVDGEPFLGKFDTDPVRRVVLIDNERTLGRPGGGSASRTSATPTP